MTSIVYTAFPQGELENIADSLNRRTLTKADVQQRPDFPAEGNGRYLQLPQLWRVLQAVFTGADTSDNDKLIAAIDGLEYLDGWSDVGAAYINAPEVADIADALDKVDFGARLAVFNQHLAERAQDVSEEELADFAETFHLKGSEEFEYGADENRNAQLQSWFDELRAFYRRAADENCGIVIEFIELS